jgi:hypothetical protein
MKGIISQRGRGLKIRAGRPGGRWKIKVSRKSRTEKTYR